MGSGGYRVASHRVCCCGRTRGADGGGAVTHAAFWPTLGIQPGDPITLKVRTFRSNGGEVWDFGDGGPVVRVKSDGNAVKLAKDGYAVMTHRFQTADHHIVRVEHTSPLGLKATAHLHVIVGPNRQQNK